MLERDFQAAVIRRLYDEFDGCLVLKNDPNYKQGIPDLVIFYESKYAFLEVKASAKSRVRPNQEYYVSRLDGMSFARFISPENEESIFSELRDFMGL